MLTNLFSHLSFFLPEAALIVIFCFVIILESFYSIKEKGREIVYTATFTGLIFTFILLAIQLSLAPVKIFSNALVIDKFSTVAKMIMVIATIGAVYISMISKDIYDTFKGEFNIMVLGVLCGGMLLASANNLLIVYLGIEILSILSYVLASFKRDNTNSNEAGVKYLLYGGVSAGIMLFGMSHLYGFLGTINFAEMALKINTLQGHSLWIVMASFLLFFVGIGYKIATVPFHMWSPDVYEGSPIPVTSFFALVPKMAGLAILIRVTMTFFGDASPLHVSWIGLLHIIAALTMCVGNISAIGQESVKRMLAFSSIGHVGMMLMGVIVMNAVGARDILFYVFTYIFMTTVAFAITAHVSNQYGTDSNVAFKGLIYKKPVLAIAMMIALFSLAGLPPFAGFIAKFNIISAAVEGGQYGIALIAAINSVVALYYYMYLVKKMVFDQAMSHEGIDSANFKHQFFLSVITLPIILLGIFWNDIMMIADGAKLF